MATDVQKRVLTRENRVAFEASWDVYQVISGAIGDQHVRLSYDGEMVELMSPGPGHEIFKTLAECLIRTLAGELNVPRMAMGSTGWERPEVRRALEADSAFYLTPEKIAVARRRPKNPADYPLPDLAIEIDISPSQVDRAGIYAALGVPEVWRFDGERLRIDQLGPDGSYSAGTGSRFFGITGDEGARLLLADFEDEADFLRIVTEWVRQVLVPRRAERRRNEA